MIYSVTYHAPKGDERVVEMRSVTFFDGQAVMIDDENDVEFIVKLMGNPHFEVVEATPREALKSVSPVFADAASAHVETDDHAALVAEAKALGIEVDGRWGNARLEAEISKAKIANL